MIAGSNEPPIILGWQLKIFRIIIAYIWCAICDFCIQCYSFAERKQAFLLFVIFVYILILSLQRWRQVLQVRRAHGGRDIPVLPKTPVTLPVQKIPER